MVFVKKIGSGDYYLYKSSGKSKRKRIEDVSNIFLIKEVVGGSGYVESTNTIIFPKDLVGKRVMFRVEVIE